MPTKYPRKRIDFEFKELVRIPGKQNLYNCKIVPDPQRYEHRIVDGIDYLYDKFDKELIGPYEETMQEITRNMKGVPVGMIRPKITDFLYYVGQRKAIVRNLLDGQQEVGYQHKDASDDFLAKLVNDHEAWFVILCIDIKGSTKMSQQISSKDNAKVIMVFLQEMASLVGNYNGFVLKYVGDGLIAYFPILVFPGMDDTAVDCAIAMKRMIHEGINPLLKDRGLPEIHFRIGIDSGDALVQTVGDAAVKMHKDLIGFTINLATKIQSAAPGDGIVIGDATLRGLHFAKRKRFQVFKPNRWKYKMTPDSPEMYPIHLLS